jgi:hypothetical protein
MLFSHRKNLKSFEKTIQLEDVDDELRASLWSLLCLHYWEKWDYHASHYDPVSRSIDALCNQIWFSYFKHPLDTKPIFKENHGPTCYGILRDYFFECRWFEVYDIIEFIIKNTPAHFCPEFPQILNSVLERENSAYRLVGREFTQITSQSEIESVDAALRSPHRGVSTHIQAAIGMLSDRNTPDYRNSIKESISAVESLVKIISREDNATLAGGLKKLKDIHPIHPALEKGFLSIYGFTSDSNGIRHALLDQATVDHADAKFMLVACSAFINYVTEKTKE